MRNFILSILIIVISTALYAKQNNSTNTIDSLKFVLDKFEIENNNSTKDIVKLKIKISSLETKIAEFENKHNEQVNFYERIINSNYWIVGIILTLISGAFAIIIWVFKKPEEIFKRLITIEANAKDLLEKLEKQHLHQESLFILGDKGIYDYEKDDWKLVELFANRALNCKEENRSANDWYFIGLTQYHEKTYNQAIESFKKSIKLNPNFQEAHKDMGNVYSDLGKYEESVKCYEEIIRINPLCFKANNNLGIAYSALNKFGIALEFFRKSIEINPKQGLVYTNLFELQLIQNIDFDEALEEKFEQIFKDKNKARSKYEMLQVLKRVKYGDEVESLLDKWKTNGYQIASNEDYTMIDKWIEKEENESIKKNLIEAISFFKLNTQK